MRLNLTFNELLYIDDKLTMPGEGLSASVRPSEIAAPMDLLRRVSEAIAGYDNTADATIHVEEHDLWLLRELATSQVAIGDEQVGYNLKIKIHRLLQETRLASIMMDFKEAQEAPTVLSATSIKKLLEEHASNDAG